MGVGVGEWGVEGGSHQVKKKKNQPIEMCGFYFDPHFDS